MIGSPHSLALLFVISSVFAGSLFSSAGPSTCAAEEGWPQWRGPLGNGTWAAAPELPARLPDEPLPLRWTRPIGPGYAGVVVAEGRVLTMDRPAEPEHQERVLCFAAETGELLWEHAYPAVYGDLEYGKGPRAAPTVFDQRVYTIGAVGHLCCLDARTGQPLWKKHLIQDFGAVQPTWGFAASPVIFQDLVIVHGGSEQQGCYIALDQRTGEVRWRGGAGAIGYATPILIEHATKTQLIGWTPDYVVSLSPETGEEYWRVPYKVTLGVSIAPPMFHRGIVFVAGYWEGSKAIRLGERPEEAELIWEENRYLRGLMSQPLARDEYGYLLDKHHGLICFRISNGEIRWTDKNQLTPRDRNPQASLVWLGDSDRALALNAQGELVLVRLSPRGYEELGRTRIVGETWAHPGYAYGCVFARDDEQIVCVQLEQE